MFKHFKKIMSNEKGFTLVEILVVISIIAILFVTLLPQIDFAGDKARQTGVKTDFHTFQVATESYLREVAGQGLNKTSFNTYLDKGMQTKTHGNSTTVTIGLDSLKKDPWGKEYDIYIHPTEEAIVIKSFGKDEIANNADDFILATYYHQGKVGSCTAGFETNNVDTELITDPKNDCGKTRVDGTTALGTPAT